MTVEFCDARACEAAAAAKEAKLENVRMIALRSEAAWRTMASRLRSTIDQRNASVAAKVAERAAEENKV